MGLGSGTEESVSMREQLEAALHEINRSLEASTRSRESRRSGPRMAGEVGESGWCRYASANFERLVLGCVNADFCNQILIFQHFFLIRSTTFAHVCTAPKFNNLATFCSVFLGILDVFFVIL